MKLSEAILAAAVAVLALGNAFADCPAGWTTFPNGKSDTCYLEIANPVTDASVAVDLCWAQGGYLMSFGSDTTSFLDSLAALRGLSFGSPSVWVGANKRDTEWQWGVHSIDPQSANGLEAWSRECFAWPFLPPFESVRPWHVWGLVRIKVQDYSFFACCFAPFVA